ncbi:nuclear transport factor 2 family protein [Streptomyces huiliensis]|uniref:nuclear transport factor 2 family protein n=1 Tax=Streptomyces huiliensis TaxID=2876027 RepID=UPI001CBBA7D3|nr:nuclear transport factor 2 family protein [Streptomyces huiliensis]MBZ4321414.1 nuclear transport factor 2 family protein [Streptomyces huiliensis]
MTTPHPAHAPEHPHVAILRAIYADLSRFPEYAADDIVLHRADRRAEDPPVCRGIDAVLAHEQALVRLTAHTLTMDVSHIAATDHFGAVLGVLRATHPRPFAMPFCGLWRFADGRVVEHWENAYDPAALQDLFARPTPPKASA